MESQALSVAESSRPEGLAELPIDSMSQPSPKNAVGRKRVSHAVEKSAELLLLGQFEDALSVLGPFHDRKGLSSTDAVAIGRAEARVYHSRGYPRLAQNALTKTKQEFHLHLDPLSALQLSVHLAFVTTVGCGETPDDEALLQEGQDTLDKQDINGYDRSSIEMQAQLDKIAIVKQTLNRLEHSNCLPGIAKRLDPLMQRSRRLRHFQEIWMLSVPYFATKSNEEVARWLEGTLADTELPRCLYAEFSLELAKRMIETSLKSAFATWLTNADNAFEEVAHAFGRTEVRRLRLQHGLEESPNPLQELVGITVKYIEADYPLAVLNSAISPLTLAFNRGHFGLYINLQECFHNTCKEAGLKLERLFLEVQLLAALNAGTGHYATVSQLGKSLYEECIDLRYWTVAYLAGRVLSLALNMRGNNQESLEIAEALYEMCQREGLQARSEAAFHVAVVRGSKVRQNSPGRRENCLEVANFLLPTVEADIETNEIKMACDKLTFVAQLQLEIARLSTEHYQRLKSEACKTIDQVKALESGLDGNDKIMVEGICDEMMCTQLLFEGDKQSDDAKEIEGLQICTRLIEAYNKHDLKFHAAMKYQFRGLFHQQLYKKEGNLKKKIERLVDAERDLERATKLFGAIGSWQQALDSRHALARIHVEAWDLVKISPDFVMSSLQQLEAMADHQRRELSMFGGLTALLQKQKFSGTSQLQDLYNWAIAVSAISGMEKNLLVWSQKRKARGLSEMLGLGILVPASVREAMRGDPSTAPVFDELEALRFAFQSAPPKEKAYIMQRVEDCERSARKNPVYDDFIALRDGVVTRIAELGVLKTANDAAEQQRTLIFADWIVRRDFLYLVTADASSPETTCCMHPLPITLCAVRGWIAQHFQTDKMRKECLQRDNFDGDSKPLRKLDALISPLRQVSKPGDLLLLSPTVNLSALPLHALRIDAADRMPLIERNPVVYVPSLPIAKICTSRVSQGDESHESLFFGVFDKVTEAKLIYKQMKSFATEMRGQSISGQAATKERYMAAVPKARLIHHHLHCVFSADNILKQSVVLSPQAQQPSAQPGDGAGPGVGPATGHNSDNKPAPEALSALKHANTDIEDLLLSSTDSPESNLTVEEIFGLVLNSPLVVLVACESASQTISEGDEPLGLITGYLCAGAASVIGASWPIPSNAGRQFSETFYREAMKSTSAVLNLALALQEAVLTIRDEPSTSSTYHWGAFCLYGAWLFQPPWLDS